MAGWLEEASRGPSLRSAPGEGHACAPVCSGESRSLRSGSLGEEPSWPHSQGPVLVGPLEFSSQGSLVEKSLRILRGQGQKHGAPRDMDRGHTREDSRRWGRFGSQNPAEDSKSGTSGLLRGLEMASIKKRNRSWDPSHQFCFFLTREKGVKLHSRNRGGPVWLGQLLDGLEMTLRCTEPCLMPPWAPERSSHWQPIRAQSPSAAGVSLAL